MQSMMYPHFVFTHSHSTIAQIEFSVIDLDCCSNDDIGNESEAVSEDKRITNAPKLIYVVSVSNGR